MPSHETLLTSAQLHGAVGSVQAYQIARRIADLSWDDTDMMLRDPRLRDVSPQLYRAISSIVANIAEGYARRSRADRIRYYEYALGSVQESIAWYESAHRVLTRETLDSRQGDLVSIRRLLLTMIRTERGAKSRTTPLPSPTNPGRLAVSPAPEE